MSNIVRHDVLSSGPFFFKLRSLGNFFVKDSTEAARDIVVQQRLTNDNTLILRVQTALFRAVHVECTKIYSDRRNNKKKDNSAKTSVMKTKSPAFLSQCQVLTLPCMSRRKKSAENSVYTQLLTFPPPVMTPAVGEGAFPLIQMMNGKEPVVWEAPIEGQGGVIKNGGSGHKNGGVVSKGTAGTSLGIQGGKTVSKGKIPRPKNAFILYRSHVSQMLKEAMAFKVRESNISSLVSEMWKKESEAVHAYYAKRAALEWVQYMKQLQKDRCAQTAELERTRSPTPPTKQVVEPVEPVVPVVPVVPVASVAPVAPAVNVSTTASVRVSAQQVPSEATGAELYQQLSTLSSPGVTNEEKSTTVPFTGTFFSNAVYGSSPDATCISLATTETSTQLSSPRSSNEEILDPLYPISAISAHTEKPGYPVVDKAHSSMLFPPLTTAPTMLPGSLKDPAFSTIYDMNPLDMGYGYTIPNHFSSVPEYPYMTGTGLGLESCMHWSEWMSAPTAWPVHM